MHKLFKNFILCGELEYHCLLCSETFLSLEDTEKHIRWETHRKILRDQVLFPKFKKDLIYKIREHYYCEYCNYITTNMDIIAVHVTEEKHRNARNLKQTVNMFFVDCKRDEETGFIIVSDIIMNLEQWNAIENPSKCLLCDVTLEPRLVERHIIMEDHVIKLIQARVILENADRCYRKINDDLNYCFSCKRSVTTPCLSAHWSTQEHLNNTSAGISRMTKSTETKVHKEVYKSNESKRRLLEMQKVLYDINLKDMSATCKICSKKVAFLGRAMLHHQKEHNENLQNKDDSSDMIEILADTLNVTLSDDEEEDKEIIDNGRRKHELANIGRKHYLKLVPGGSRAYCLLCNAYMPTHIRTFKQHIRGISHKCHMEIRGLKKLKAHERAEYETKPLKEFIRNIYHAHPIRTLWVNKEISIHTHSFVLIAPVLSNPHYLKTLCYACNVEYVQGEDEEHYRNVDHKNNFLDADVIISLRGEFIREVHPNIYHCGFCNRIYPYWDCLKQHLRSHHHKRAKRHRKEISETARKWYKENMLSIVSTNPDIMYMQLLQLGIFCL